MFAQTEDQAPLELPGKNGAPDATQSGERDAHSAAVKFAESQAAAAEQWRDCRADGAVPTAAEIIIEDLDHPAAVRRGRSQSGGWVAGPIVLSLLFYILLPGPLDYMFDRFPRRTQTLVEIGLFPLEWAYERSEAVEAFYDWYLDLWE